MSCFSEAVGISKNSGQPTIDGSPSSETLSSNSTQIGSQLGRIWIDFVQFQSKKPVTGEAQARNELITRISSLRHTIEQQSKTGTLSLEDAQNALHRMEKMEQRLRISAQKSGETASSARTTSATEKMLDPTQASEPPKPSSSPATSTTDQAPDPLFSKAIHQRTLIDLILTDLKNPKTLDPTQPSEPPKPSNLSITPQATAEADQTIANLFTEAVQQRDIMESILVHLKDPRPLMQTSKLVHAAVQKYLPLQCVDRFALNILSTSIFSIPSLPVSAKSCPSVAYCAIAKDGFLFHQIKVPPASVLPLCFLAGLSVKIQEPDRVEEWISRLDSTIQSNQMFMDYLRFHMSKSPRWHLGRFDEFVTRYPKLSDARIWRLALQQDGLMLLKAPSVIQKSAWLVSHAVRQNGLSLAYADPSLQSNRNIVLLAVQQSGMALLHASPELKKDFDIVKTAVQQRGWALSAADESLLKNPEIVEAAVRQDGFALHIADKSFMKNRKIVQVAIGQDGQALQFADPELKKDIKMVTLAIAQNGQALRHASIVFRRDPRMVKKAIENNPKALEWAAPALRNNEEIIKLAESKSPLAALKGAGTAFRHDKEFVERILQKDGLALRVAGMEWRDDENAVQLAVEQNGLALQYASPRLRKNRKLVRLAVRNNGLALRFAYQAFKNDRKIVEIAVRNNGAALEIASSSLQKDERLIELARRQKAPDGDEAPAAS